MCDGVTQGHAGMELSLAKFLGSTILTLGVLALCIKFVYPPVERWIGHRG